MKRRFLALVGSPRPHSTSAGFAQHLADRLRGRDWETEILTACRAVRLPDQWPALEEAFAAADAIAVVSPLYVDSLPAELIMALERLAGVRVERPCPLFAVLNCGFAEAAHNDTAIAICRLFARDAGLHWAGGLAIGSGGMFAGKPLEEQGGQAAHITSAFDEAAAAIDAGRDIPESAIAGIRRLSIPAWAYFGMANLSMLAEAVRHGTLLRIGAKPHQP